MLQQNIILLADSYKASHYAQYPKGTSFVSSYIEARNTKNEMFRNVVFFGLQAFIKQYLLKPITQQDIDQAADFFQKHAVPFYKEGWQYILDKYQGKLPVTIQSLSEGTVSPIGTCLVQIINNDPQCYWLVSYLETALLRAVWYPSTIATLSFALKNVFKDAMEKSCDTLDKLPFMLNDFAPRAVSSNESSILGGMAHTLSFAGSDNVAAVIAVHEYYNQPKDQVVAYSVPAAEHSTITSWTRSGEIDAYSNMIEQYGDGLFAVVSDSYDIYHAVNNIWGGVLKEKVESLKGTLVIRPDSGDPIKVLLGDDSSTDPLVKRGLFGIIEDKFGVTLNTKGYKLFPNYVRLIQGDGIDINSLPKIIEAILEKGYSLDNIVFGMGGGLLQQVNRDTIGWTMKCSAIKVNDTWIDVFKDPITSRAKVSKKGRLAVVYAQDKLQTVRVELAGTSDLLTDVYYNGKLLVDDSFSTIQQRLNNRDYCSE